MGARESKPKTSYIHKSSVKKHLNEIEKDAKETLIAAVEGDNLRMMLSALRKLTRSTPYNVIAKKREASVKLIDAEKYIV